MKAIKQGVQKYWALLRQSLGRWFRARDLQEKIDFATDAEWTILQQQPQRPRIFIWTVGGLFVSAVLWAALAQIDEVARGEGKVVSSFQNQHIQSLDGGIVQKILVREGQVVTQGQMLLQIDSTRARASLNENRAQTLALEAKAARLRALAEGRPFLLPPIVLQEGGVALVAQETELFNSRQRELEASLSIARQQLAQRDQELREVRARRRQAQESFDLTSRELAVTAPLQAVGAVSEVDLLRLEREVARARGELQTTQAQLARIQAAITESTRKIQEVELNFRNHASSELSEVMARLNSLTAGHEALEDRVKLTAVRAPVAGEVKRLFLNTVGSVVQPGKDIIELVPSDDSLLLETRISPRDIPFLYPGQKAVLRFTAYDYSVYGVMHGEVQAIGADSVVDEKGQPYYIVKVRTHGKTLSSSDQTLRIIPGMVAQVDILTGKKSVLTYLFKPILRAHSRSLSER